MAMVNVFLKQWVRFKFSGILKNISTKIDDITEKDFSKE